MSKVISQAIQEVQDRLQAILIASGYNTDAGNQVYLGRKSFTERDTFPLLSVFTGSEEVEPAQFGVYTCNREIRIEGHVQDADTPTVSIELLIEDIQQAMEQTDITLGGLVTDLQYEGIAEPDEPDSGSEYASLSVIYRIEYERTYGA